MVNGRLGRFPLLRGQSRKLRRAALSAHAAEVVAADDGVDVTRRCRDQMADMLHGPVPCGHGMKLYDLQIQIAVVTDSQDGRDRLTRDTAAGSATHNSIHLQLSSIRDILVRPQPHFRWTDGTDMISDCLAK